MVANQKKGNILSGIFWMFLISILLFWLPGFGPLIAGIVGGKKAGGLINAIIAVFLPAIILGIMLFVFGSALTSAPIIGFVAGAGSFILVISNVGPLLIGAIIGGILD
ncbi:MAG: hypothetical protein E2O70_03460 [Candidatus Dadabacteria bacterium]|nr:MAG: hypothetical protein E2O70_03460 [Candidatus Dadabacteria bacterium]